MGITLVAISTALVAQWVYQVHIRRQKDSMKAPRTRVHFVNDHPTNPAFLLAASSIKELSHLSAGEKLVLYALYKQATSYWNAVFAERAKHDSWKQLRGMSSEEAAARYVVTVQDIKARNSGHDHDQDDDDSFDGVPSNGFGHAQSVPAAVENGGFFEDHNNSSETELLNAASANDTEKLRDLLEREGVDVNMKDSSGQTALHLAADKGALQSLFYLLEAGADVKATDHDGISALQAAVIAGNVKACQMLIDYGADPDQVDADGDSPRSCAQDDGDVEMKNLFIDHVREQTYIANADSDAGARQ
jgi:acyl-CoA-binding protein